MGELDRYCEQINLELTEQDVARLGWNKPMFSKWIPTLSAMSLLALWLTYWFY
ncbi:conserved hypothetical protein [Vibrio chagasii]|uniref:hypothetical protein n=1 Tax=Vibrio TaxID=662 RepID=UPI0020A5BD7F|nr:MULTISPECIES: hypothetical protein [Vibrio]CAH6817392.1 conserved hypothetical protein [Vibrio chagasii]CAH6978067.1 conserved hypothetical protein [Vibrio chagasii]CAH6983938.1 conserved hypothetical protein [Vibrio chagasii]CAH7001933.1 conserved hypothetical protein [Vibrio chagasii]CAH7012195.1 conserved hypothetical protein [Vibrio chagasii]